MKKIVLGLSLFFSITPCLPSQASRKSKTQATQRTRARKRKSKHPVFVTFTGLIAVIFLVYHFRQGAQNNGDEDNHDSESKNSSSSSNKNDVKNEWEEPIILQHEGYLLYASFDPSNSSRFVSLNKKKIYLWDTEESKDKPIKSFNLNKDTYQCILSPPIDETKNQFLAYKEYYQSKKVAIIKTNEDKPFILSHDNNVTNFLFSSSSKDIRMVSQTKQEVIIWKYNTEKTTWHQEGKLNFEDIREVEAFYFNQRSGTRIVTQHRNQQNNIVMTVWECEKNGWESTEEIETRGTHASANALCTCIAIKIDNEKVSTWRYDENQKTWNQEDIKIKSDKNSIPQNLSMDTKGEHLVISYKDKTRIFKYTIGANKQTKWKEEHTLDSQNGTTFMAPSGKFIILHQSPATIKLFTRDKNKGEAPSNKYQEELFTVASKFFFHPTDSSIIFLDLKQVKIFKPLTT